MVVDDLYIECNTVLPTKADSPLIVNPDVVLASSLAFKAFEAIGRWYPQIIDRSAG